MNNLPFPGSIHHERSMAQVGEWEADSTAEQDILTMIFGESLDITLLSFVSLDENDREALL